MTRRQVRRVACFAGLGLITGVLLACFGSVLIRVDEMTFESATELPWTHRYRSLFWAETSLVTFLGTDPNRQDSPSGRRMEVSRLTYSTGPPPMFTPEPGPVRKWRFVEAGWPFTALWGWSMSESGLPDARDEASGIIEVPMLRSLHGQTDQTDLPYLPVWSGLAANTAVFALVWWCLVSGPPLLRRKWRRRRGHCPACGYDLRASAGKPCPECGS
jgi:hypothetical protein